MTEAIYAAQRKARMGEAPELIPGYFARIGKGKLLNHQEEIDLSKRAKTGDEVARYRHVSDESGRWLEVAFCRRCGTNLGFTLEAVPGVCTLPAGAFDDPTWIKAKRYKFRHVFLRSRREWSDLSPHVEQYERHFRS